MLKFCGVARNSFLALTFIIVFVSHICNASLVFHVRKLIASAPDDAFSTSQVAPSGSPVNKSNTTAMNSRESQEHKQKESQMDSQTNSTKTLPIDSKGSNRNDNGNKNSSGPSPSAARKNDNIVGSGNVKGVNVTMPTLGDSGSCKGSLTSCRDQEMFACMKASKGSNQMFLVVQNEGETTLEVNVNLPNYLTNDLPAFEVPKHEIRRMDISSTVGKSTELIVDSGKAKCTLRLARSVSIDNLVQQLSFYSKQVTPIHAAYTSFFLLVLFGGILACCKLRKRNQENGVPYQGLEMGLPESVSAVNADATEGWDHDWVDDDDWEEDGIVRSPAPGRHIRSVPVDGLTSRSSKKDGWGNDWND